MNTYLREEIQVEQIVRKMEPFRLFLEIAAAANGKILNASKLGRQCGIDPKTSQRYFEILVDTLVLFYLPAYDTSIRKQQTTHPKIFWFDQGVARAAAGFLDEAASTSTFEYGNLFEQLVIVEAIKLNDATETYAKLMYFRSADDAEIDLIIHKGRTLYAIEIKSAKDADITDIKKLNRICGALPRHTKKMILCNATAQYMQDDVHVINWQDGLRMIFCSG